MFKGILDILLFKDYAEYKEIIQRKNFNSFDLLLAIGIPISVMNFAFQSILSGRLSNWTTLTLVLLYIMLAFIKHFLLPDDYEDSTNMLYLASGVVFFHTIMMGTILDTNHQALTFLMYLLINPIFVLDKPWRNISFTTFWTVLFLILSRIVKPYSVFRGDNIHGVEFYFASIVMTYFVMSIRIRGLRVMNDMEYLLSHDSLTGIFNGSAAYDRAKEYVGRNASIAVLRVESLEFYKDMYGSEFTEDIMLDFVTILKRYYKEDDLYMIGDGKIAIVVSEETEVDIIRNLNLIKAEFIGNSFDEHDLYLTFSTGYIVGNCKSEMDLKTMIRQADIYCLQASTKARGSVEGGAYDRSDKYNDKLKETFNRLIMEEDLDKMTGLLTIRAFFSKTREIIAMSPNDLDRFVFLYFNIANMKEYNSKYGYDKGDGFIKNISDCLKENFDSRLVARFGEDHFSVLCYEEEAEENVRKVFDKIKIYHRIPTMSLNCGIARWQTDITMSECCDRARIACETTKRKYGNNIVWFDDEMLLKENKKNYFIENLNNAINENKIKVLYQPIYDIKKDEIFGYEALSRWENDEGVLISPSEYVPILEEENLIDKLDKYVIRQVLSDLKKIIDVGGKPIPVSLNLSYYDFANGEPEKRIPALVDSYEVPRDLLRFEISEHAFFQKHAFLDDGIRMLKKEGFDVWLDDYGKEYSSLNLVLEQKFSVIKLNIKYMKDVENNVPNQNFIKSLSLLAKDIGSKALCVGIENEDEYNFVRSAFVELGQGFYYAEPKSLYDLE